MDILIFGGQSNMQGQTEALSETEVAEGAFEYRFLSDALVPLRNPVGEDIRNDGTAGIASTEATVLSDWLREHALGASWCGHTNMVPAFCRAYRRETGASVAAVHAAKGSTVIAEWLPGTAGYAVLTKKALAAIRKVRSFTQVGHIYFVWLQGESDAILSSGKEEYKEKLIRLASALKQDIGVERFGVIRVGKFVKDARDQTIMDAQSEACATNPDFLMLTDIAAKLYDMPQYMNPFVGGHYSAAGLEYLGETAGTALGKFAAKQ